MVTPRRSRSTRHPDRSQFLVDRSRNYRNDFGNKSPADRRPWRLRRMQIRRQLTQLNELVAALSCATAWVRDWSDGG